MCVPSKRQCFSSLSPSSLPTSGVHDSTDNVQRQESVWFILNSGTIITPPPTTTTTTTAFASETPSYFLFHQDLPKCSVRLINIFVMLMKINNLEAKTQLEYDMGVLSAYEKYVYLELALKFCENDNINYIKQALNLYKKDNLDQIKQDSVTESKCLNFMRWRVINQYFDEVHSVALIKNILNKQAKEFSNDDRLNSVTINMFLKIKGLGGMATNFTPEMVKYNFSDQVKDDLASLKSTGEKYLYLTLVVKLCSTKNLQEINKFFEQQIEIMYKLLIDYSKIMSSVGVYFPPNLDIIYNAIDRHSSLSTGDVSYTLVEETGLRVNESNTTDLAYKWVEETIFCDLVTIMIDNMRVGRAMSWQHVTEIMEMQLKLLTALGNDELSSCLNKYLYLTAMIQLCCDKGWSAYVNIFTYKLGEIINIVRNHTDRKVTYQFLEVVNSQAFVEKYRGVYNANSNIEGKKRKR